MNPQSPGDPTVPAVGPPSPTPYASSIEGRFVTGATLADGRYRILSLLGQGGMGEVYRAEDLKLRQIVALKFLPAAAAFDPGALARFHNEVRVARQVAHPAVCRVYDIGEENKLHFLSMEFIDGEDLASLLRRIGRLPGDKAAQIGREICAGLAAAHDQGVLHRDLKPANIMIDGRGRARITDFGLAVLSREVRGQDVLAGTPAYMAPEQLSGREATVRSDIYSLGLVLYEIFTGRRVFEAESWRELQALHESSQPASPSSLVKDIDPLAEQVILRCLQKDPKHRPSSAAQAGLSLPGGDPLQAALAAGETPSPEMVAATANTGSLRSTVAAALLFGVWAMLAYFLFLSKSNLVHTVVPLRKSPEILAERAAEFVKAFGYSNPAADRTFNFSSDQSYWDYAIEENKRQEYWRRILPGQPLTYYFWYRQSPQLLVSRGINGPSLRNPPADVPGMLSMLLDPHGRLVEFGAVPQSAAPHSQGANTDWGPLFRAAGLAVEKFHPAPPLWTPPHFADSRQAWSGPHPDHSDIPVRVEAASLGGRPIYFRIVAPWDQPALSNRYSPNRYRPDPSGGLSSILGAAILLTLIATALFLVHHNLRLGRGDRTGALRLSLTILVVVAASMLLQAHHVSGLAEVYILSEIAAFALLYAVVVWVFYIALEPFVRRNWPALLIGWTRLLAGDFRDPMVGRDILIGGFAGLFGHSLMIRLGHEVDGLLQPKIPFAIPPNPGWLDLLSNLAIFLHQAILMGLSLLLFLLIAYILVRRQWLATLLVGLVFFAYLIVSFGDSWPHSVSIVFQVISFMLVLSRFGLLASISYPFFFLNTAFFPFTSDTSLWYAGYSYFIVMLLAALAAFGFFTAIGNQRLLPAHILPD